MPTTLEYDLIVIGSGMAGLHSAYPAVMDGLKVALLDIGTDEHAALEKDLPLSFEETRRYNPAQYKIFLGDDLSGVPIAADESGYAGGMTAGRRSYITRGSKTLLPVKTKNAAIFESAATGGLSEAWGAACSFFDKEECEAVGIPYEEMRFHYTEIIKRIGVSGPQGFFNLQPAAPLDDQNKKIMRYSHIKKERLATLGFSIEQPPLAMLTEDLGARKKNAYRDMDFWDNIGRSVYRGHYTLEELLARDTFTYIRNTLVLRIADSEKETVVTARDLNTDKEILYKAKAVIVAAGAINTTRILLRSFGLFNTPVPILLKNNHLIPCLMLSMLGKAPNPHQHSLCQLSIHDIKRCAGMEASYTQIYSYKSLLLHKLLRYVPLPVPQALSILSILAPALILADMRTSSTSEQKNNAALLINDQGEEYLEITYIDTPENKAGQKSKVREIKKALRALGLLPLTAVRSLFGTTSHYGGGVPHSDIPLSTPSVNTRGQVHGAEHIFVADSAAWRSLPAKSPGLTIMANANRVGSHAREYVRHFAKN